MTKRSPLALAVLALLVEAPMHPYRMQQLITERGKDDVINVSQRPERSVYEITDAGRAAAQQWMREMLTDPRPEYPEFAAAVAHLPMITPGQSAEYLAGRATALEAEVARLEASISSVKDWLPRLFLLDTELLLDLRRTELRWTTAVLEDLKDGSIDWSRESLDAFAAAHPNPYPEDSSS